MITTTMELAALDGGRVSLAATALDELAAGVDGPLLRSGDEGWDDAVLIWNGMAATLPAAVVQPASAAGVAAAVRWAREHGVLLGVKGGGHHIAGLAIAQHVRTGGVDQGVEGAAIHQAVGVGDPFSPLTDHGPHFVAARQR